jgi:hypothetical protein
MRPRLESTEMELPDELYFEQPRTPTQKVWVEQSMANELESRSKLQPVFELVERTKLSILPFTVQRSLGLLQMGQAAVGADPAPAADVPSSVVATPPQAATAALTKQA